MKIKKLQKNQIHEATRLIELSFYDTVSPTLSPEGVVTFLSGCNTQSIEKRLLAGNIFRVAVVNNIMVAVGEIRNENHLNLLFVSPDMQRKGIGKALLQSLIDTIKHDSLTVNSSLNSIQAYKTFGFVENGSESEKGGIKYQPMLLRITG